MPIRVVLGLPEFEQLVTGKEVEIHVESVASTVLIILSDIGYMTMASVLQRAMAKSSQPIGPAPSKGAWRDSSETLYHLAQTVELLGVATRFLQHDVDQCPKSASNSEPCRCHLDELRDAVLKLKAKIGKNPG